MHTVHCSGHLSCDACPSLATHPPATHDPPPCRPPPHMPPAMQAPHYACPPLPCMPPLPWTPSPCTPPFATAPFTTHAPPLHYAWPPVDRRDDTRLWKYYLSATTVADDNDCTVLSGTFSLATGPTIAITVQEVVHAIVHAIAIVR